MADNPWLHDNPFNPTQRSGSGAPVEASWDAGTSGAWGAGGGGAGIDVDTSSNGYVPATVQLMDDNKRSTSFKALEIREAELNRRDAELTRREQELRNSGGGGGPTKNWPPFCNILHHDIAGEVPSDKQGVVRFAYIAYLGLVLCLFWNWVGTWAIMIGIGTGNLSSFLWAAIYMLGGIPGGFILWYMRLYNASIKDRAMTYFIFFFGFMVHLVFVVFWAIAPPILNGRSRTGFWSAIEVIGDNTGAGVIYFIGAGLWSLEGLWSFWTLGRAYRMFRGRGDSPAPTV